VGLRRFCLVRIFLVSTHVHSFVGEPKVGQFEIDADLGVVERSCCYHVAYHVERAGRLRLALERRERKLLAVKCFRLVETGDRDQRSCIRFDANRLNSYLCFRQVAFKLAIQKIS
jgi:hypothetical protein